MEAVIISGPRKGEFVQIETASEGDFLTAELETLLRQMTEIAWGTAHEAKTAADEAEKLAADLRQIREARS